MAGGVHPAAAGGEAAASATGPGVWHLLGDRDAVGGWALAAGAGVRVYAEVGQPPHVRRGDGPEWAIVDHHTVGQRVCVGDRRG